MDGERRGARLVNARFTAGETRCAIPCTQRPLVAFKQVLPGFDVPAASGGTGIRVAADVRVDVGRERTSTRTGELLEAGKWQVRGLSFLNVHPAPGVAELAFHDPIEAGKKPRVISPDSMLVPIKQAIAGLNKAGAVVRRIERGTDAAQEVYRIGYITLEVTFGIGGVDVARAVQIRIAQDPDSKVWSIASEPNVGIAITHPDTTVYTSISKTFFYWKEDDQQEYGALVGEFVVDQATGQTAWLQFSNSGPNKAHNAVYGWLETVYFDPVNNRRGVDPKDPRRKDPL